MTQIGTKLLLHRNAYARESQARTVLPVIKLVMSEGILWAMSQALDKNASVHTFSFILLFNLAFSIFFLPFLTLK